MWVEFRQLIHAFLETRLGSSLVEVYGSGRTVETFGGGDSTDWGKKSELGEVPGYHHS